MNSLNSNTSSNSQINDFNKRERERENEPSENAFSFFRKKAKSTTTTTTTLTTTTTTTTTTNNHLNSLNPEPPSIKESALSLMRDTIQALSGWRPTSSSQAEMVEVIDTQKRELNEVYDAISSVAFPALPFTQLNHFRLTLEKVIRNMDLPEVERHFIEMMKNNGLDAFLEDCSLDIDNVLHLFLDICIQKSSAEHFSKLIKTVQEKRPSFLNDEMFINKMRKIFNQEECADLTFTLPSTDGKEPITVNVNQAYLEAFVPSFHPHFGLVHIKGNQGVPPWQTGRDGLATFRLLKSNHVQDILRYCYTRTIFFRGIKDCLEILTIAEKWKIKPLIEICDAYLVPRSIWGWTQDATLWNYPIRSCPKLMSRLLDWAISELLQRKVIPTSQLLEQEREKVTKLTISSLLTDPQINAIPTLFPHIQSVIIHRVQAEDLQVSLLSRLKELRKVKLIGTSFSHTLMKSMISSNPSLASIKLIDCPDPHSFLKNSDPGKIRIFKMTMLIDNTDLKVLMSWENLESLYLQLSQINNGSIENLGQLKKLRKLDIQSFLLNYAKFPWRKLDQIEHLNITKLDGNEKYGITATNEYFSHIKSFKSFKSNLCFFQFELLPIISKWKSIRELSIKTFNTENIIENEKEVSFPSIPSLMSLEWDCQGMAPNLSFLKSLVNIQKLDLKNAQLNDAIIAQIRKFPYLHTLHLYNVILDDDALVAIADLPLESLSLIMCDPFTYKSLKVLSKSKTLQNISIQSCANVGMFSADLQILFPKVKELKFAPNEDFSFPESRLDKIAEANPTNDYLLCYLTYSQNPSHLDLAVKYLKIAIAMSSTPSDSKKSMYWKFLGIAHFKLDPTGEDDIQAMRKAIEFGCPLSDDIPYGLRKHFLPQNPINQ